MNTFVYIQAYVIAKDAGCSNGEAAAFAMHSAKGSDLVHSLRLFQSGREAVSDAR